jgi:hypothetical protein
LDDQRLNVMAQFEGLAGTDGGQCADAASAVVLGAWLRRRKAQPKTNKTSDKEKMND